MEAAPRRSFAFTAAMVNHYYFYCIDKDFGPFFIKFCSYFPYTSRLCINGHEYLKRQLAPKGIFFEQVIRENLDAGRPDKVQLIFNRRIHRNTPGRFRTRVITQGVTPSLHIDYKNTRIKQYHKEGRALRTETTINNTRDFGIGRRLHSLSALRAIGFQANRRLLDVQTISHDPAIGEDAFRELTRPLEVCGQRTSGLRFGDPTVLALFLALLIFRLLPNGFSNRDPRERFAPLLGKHPDDITAGQMTYQPRRLRVRGLIRRIPRTHRYEVTDSGIRTALFFTCSASSVLRPVAAALCGQALSEAAPMRRILRKLQQSLASIPELKQAV